MLKNQYFLQKAIFAPEIQQVIQVAQKTWHDTYQKIISEQQIEYMFSTMYSVDALTYQIQNLGHTFWLAYNNQTPNANAVGFMSFKVIQNEDKETVANIFKLYINPCEQGKGLGWFFLQTLENELKSIYTPAAILQLNVNRNNKPALQFYKKYGFVIHQSVDIPYQNYTLNDYVMQKKI